MTTYSEIASGEEASAKILSGAKMICEPVIQSIGPDGVNTLLQRNANEYYATNDGVTIAKNIIPKCPFEKAVAQIILQSAMKTNAEAGDGTSTTMAIAYHTLKGAMATKILNPYQIRLTLNRVSKDFAEFIEAEKKDCDIETLNQVAYVSSQDKEIAQQVSDAFKELGTSAVINLEEAVSKNGLVIEKGLGISSGMAHPAFATNIKDRKATYENPLVVISRSPINNPSNITMLLETAHDQKRALVLVAPEIAPPVLGLMAHNQSKGSLSSLPIELKATKAEQLEIIDDLILVLNATEYEHHNYMIADAVGVTSGMTSTVFKNDGKTTDALSETIEAVQKEIKENQASEYAVSMLKKRLARLQNGYATIFIGGETKTEVEERRLRAEDAVLACKSALDFGVVIGGGVMFKEFVDRGASSNYDYIVKALCDVYYNIEGNGGEKARENNILDPAKVLVSAVKNAYSVVGSLIACKNIVAIKND